MSAPAKHWADIGETTSIAGIRVLCGVHRLFGRRAFRAIAAPVVLAHWLSNAGARRASMDYLRRLHAFAPDALGHAPSWRDGLRHFAAFAETLLDKLLALAGEFPLEKVRVERADMLRLLEQKRGAVIVTAHVGCLELCRAMAAHKRDFRMTALVHTRHAERFNRLLQRFDREGRVRLLQVDAIDPGVAAQLGERVARGEFVAIAGDRVPVGGGRFALADFLGSPAPFPVGACVLAAALQCPLATMACVRDGDGYAVRFAVFADKVELPRADRQAALERYARGFAAWLEAQLRVAPLDWFNFFPFWEQLQKAGARGE